MKELDAAEFCCGKGVLTRCLRFAGYKVVGLDILDWDPYAQERALAVTSNPLDMLSPSGSASLARIQNNLIFLQVKIKLILLELVIKFVTTNAH